MTHRKTISLLVSVISGMMFFIATTVCKAEQREELAAEKWEELAAEKWEELTDVPLYEFTWKDDLKWSAIVLFAPKRLNEISPIHVYEYITKEHNDIEKTIAKDLCAAELKEPGFASFLGTLEDNTLDNKGRVRLHPAEIFLDGYNYRYRLISSLGSDSEVIRIGTNKMIPGKDLKNTYWVSVEDWPNVLAQRPDVLAQRPDVLAQRPDVLAQWPEVQAQLPEVKAQWWSNVRAMQPALLPNVIQAQLPSAQATWPDGVLMQWRDLLVNQPLTDDNNEKNSCWWSRLGTLIM